MKIVNKSESNPLLVSTLSLRVTVPSKAADSSKALKKLRTATIDGPANVNELDGNQIMDSESIFDPEADKKEKSLT